MFSQYEALILIILKNPIYVKLKPAPQVSPLFEIFSAF